MKAKEVAEKLTPYGQQIIDLLCDHLKKKGFAYWINEIGTSDELAEWLAERLRKSVKSVAGAMSDLVEKGYIGTHLYQNYGYEFDLHSRSVSQIGWLAWHGFNPKAKVQYGGLSNPEELEHWLEWDGLDGTQIGFEFTATDKDVFGSRLRLEHEAIMKRYEGKRPSRPLCR